MQLEKDRVWYGEVKKTTREITNSKEMQVETKAGAKSSLCVCHEIQPPGCDGTNE